MTTVMGASGHVGGRIAELLLDSGEKVRALGRSREKLAGGGAKGAAVWKSRKQREIPTASTSIIFFSEEEERRTKPLRSTVHRIGSAPDRQSCR
jgi:nucleoside-diphosphate-sugar epimerase